MKKVREEEDLDMFLTYQERKVAALTLINILLWLVVLILFIGVDKVKVQGKNPETLSLEPVRESVEVYPLEEEVVENTFEEYPLFTYSKDWDEEDSYLLAKIAMAEAEGESVRGKSFVIITVLNRVWDDNFPDTIKEVIMQESNGVYQFSPVIPGGRWWTTEPNEECWEAVRMVQESMYDYSGGALYFESSKDEDNWHSRNLEFLYETGNHRFYK